jgi:glycosyltransferase involved in cell wall biosynthesis
VRGRHEPARTIRAVPRRPRTAALNALFLDPGLSGGPETYLRGLVPAIAAARPDLELHLVTTRRGADTLRAEGWDSIVRLHRMPADEGERAARLRAEQLALPRLAGRRGWDLIHSLASVAPVWSPVPTVVSLHDVTMFRLRTFNAITTTGMRWIVATAGRRADALVTGSAAARDEICAELDIAADRFLVVPHGAGRVHDGAVLGEPEVRERFGLGADRVVLNVGAKRPHKNQELLLRALPLLDEDVALVLAGHEEPYDERLRDVAAEVGVTDRVRFAGYVEDDALEGLWRTAGVAAFPTLAEGFGLPVLEAMRRGTPVACSDIPVLHEVAAGHARFFDPADPGSAAAALGAALRDPGDLDAARRHAEGFTWERAAEGTLEAYDRALSER